MQTSESSASWLSPPVIPSHYPSKLGGGMIPLAKRFPLHCISESDGGEVHNSEKLTKPHPIQGSYISFLSSKTFQTPFSNLMPGSGNLHTEKLMLEKLTNCRSGHTHQPLGEVIPPRPVRWCFQPHSFQSPHSGCRCFQPHSFQSPHSGYGPRQG